MEVKTYSDFVSVRIKDLLTQIKLWEEVYENPKRIQRSNASGQLLIELQKKKPLKYLPNKNQNQEKNQTKIQNENNSTNKNEASDEDMPDLIEA